MKLKTVVVGMFICLLFAGFVQAVVFQYGTLRAFFPDTNLVIIDQQRFMVSNGTKVYRQSEPDFEISLSVGFINSKVRYESRDNLYRDPELIYLVIIDN